MTELALPAGTLENALTAFNNGADAVYFGLKDFSARKGAGNFSEEDLSKIRRYSIEKNKKIYITINTLIDDNDIPRLFDSLSMVAGYGCDGVICQDLGVVNLIRKNFPTLPLHGSTQLAVHTINGVKELKSLGFERVVLSRELNLDEIRKIRKACPDIELKVFIHGALCYGFSGLCMASHIKTGRSANEGSCAQICRTYFKDVASGRLLYPFSLEDMEAGEYVSELQRIGIDSLKIEGRLKGNEYVAATAKYYRALLDGKSGKELIHGVRTSFQRKAGPGYLESTGPGHNILTTGQYTGHMGSYIGRISYVTNHSIEIDTYENVKNRDGLMIFLEAKNDIAEPYKFAAKVLYRAKDYVEVALDFSVMAKEGMAVYMISDSSLNQKTPSLDIPLSKEGVDITVNVHDDFLTVNGRRYEANIDEARSGSYKDAFEKIFRQTGDAPFSVKSLEITNNSSYNAPFVKGSELKAIRREAYGNIKAEKKEKRAYFANTTKEKDEILPARSLLQGSRSPWKTEITAIDGYNYITLPAVTYDEERLFDEIETIIKGKSNMRIGLNNIGQIVFAKNNPEHEYFADIYLYLSNREAAELLLKECPNLIGGYLWLERDEYAEPWPMTPTVIKGFEPPLFISRACYRHDGLGLDCKGCSRHHLFNLEQNGEYYEAIVDDCQTIVRRKRR